MEHGVVKISLHISFSKNESAKGLHSRAIGYLFGNSTVESSVLMMARQKKQLLFQPEISPTARMIDFSHSEKSDSFARNHIRHSLVSTLHVLVRSTSGTWKLSSGMERVMKVHADDIDDKSAISLHFCKKQQWKLPKKNSSSINKPIKTKLFFETST